MCVPDGLQPPTRGAPSHMGCTAAGSTATARRCGRHLPLSYHLGVLYLSIDVLHPPHNLYYARHAICTLELAFNLL